jgi:hypothetical protein
VIGELGCRRRLDVVAEAGEEQMLWDLRRELGRGRARGHEQELPPGGDRRGRQHHVGVREPEHRRDRRVGVDQLAGGRGNPIETALGVGDHQLDLPPEHTAFGIGARDRELGAARRRLVEGRLRSAQIVHRAQKNWPIGRRDTG